MERIDSSHQQSGTILILALWSLGLLTIFALTLGGMVRQKIALFSRLEERNKLHLLAEAGIKKAIVILNQDLTSNKMNRCNKEKDFGAIQLDNGVCEVSYEYNDGKIFHPQKCYGIVDEESKININKADVSVLKNLIKSILGWQDSDAKNLAASIIDWREYGESEMTGFYSEDYYANLEYPYSPKNSYFEIIDELLLVKGMTEDILQKLSPYITVYGDGKINLNTAPRLVLTAMGLQEGLVDKILSVRRGPDGIEATEDDVIFQDYHDPLKRLQKFINLTEEEIAQMNEFVSEGKFVAYSHFYFLQSLAKLNKGKSSSIIKCVFNTDEHKIEYWKEEYVSF